MAENTCVILHDRGIIAIEGKDARSFLQGIITCNVDTITPNKTVYGALLTPQGKFLFDFFMSEHNNTLLVDVERDRISDFIKRLSIYKLRSDVSLSDVSGQYQVMALFGTPGALDDLGLASEPGHTKPFGNGVIFTDPRLSAAGARVIMSLDEADTAPETTQFIPGTKLTYDTHRISLGLPDGSQDLIVEKSILLENGFDELNGIDWHKGCYMGQEVTARTKHRGLVKKRLVCVDIDGPPPAIGAPILAEDRNAGEMRSCVGNQGLALIKLDFLDGWDETDRKLIADKATIRPRKPDWAIF